MLGRAMGCMREGGRRGDRTMRGTSRGLEVCGTSLQRGDGGVRESIYGRPKGGRVLSARSGKRSRVQWRVIRHQGRAELEMGASSSAIPGSAMHRGARAIAAMLRGFVLAAGGVCYGRFDGPEDGRQRLVDGGRRSAGAQRSLPILRLERRASHSDNCSGGAWIDGGFVAALARSEVKTSQQHYGAAAQ